MSWRPEEWKNPYREYLKEHHVYDAAFECFAQMYEAGADAMLEALRKQAGVVLQAGQVFNYTMDAQSGKIVFVPDDD